MSIKKLLASPLVRALGKRAAKKHLAEPAADLLNTPVGAGLQELGKRRRQAHEEGRELDASDAEAIADAVFGTEADEQAAADDA